MQKQRQYNHGTLNKKTGRVCVCVCMCIPPSPLSQVMFLSLPPSSSFAKEFKLFERYDNYSGLYM